jgi:hypothetical protein
MPGVGRKIRFKRLKSLVSWKENEARRCSFSAASGKDFVEKQALCRQERPFPPTRRGFSAAHSGAQQPNSRRIGWI